MSKTSEASAKQYQGDGHVETIDPTRLTLGNVVRMPYSSGSVSPFGDATVTGIYRSFVRNGLQERTHYSSLGEALRNASHKDDYVWVKLARPYCYANNPFESMPNWLVGVESYEVMGNRVGETHKVVVMSTGDYADYNHSRTLPIE